MNQIGRARGGIASLVLVGSLVLASCGGDTHPQVPTTLTKGGDNQTSTVGTVTATAPSVTILDADGRGIAGIAVTFALLSGGGTLAGVTATTNSAGVATAGSWTLGTTAGTNTITATALNVPGSPVTFTATGVAGAPATMVKVSTDPTKPPAGSNVDSIVVKVSDQFGNPVGGAVVTFAVVSGGGSVSPTTVPAGANGQAAARWTIGTTPGTANSATATCAGLASTVTFSATSGLAVASVRFTARLFVMDSLATITPGVSAFDPQGNVIAGAGISLVVRSPAIATTSGSTVTAARTGQTFLVATSTDNANALDSALVVVANIGGPVVIATVPRFDIKTDTTFTVPIIIDMRSSGEKVAATTLQLTWDPGVLTYVSSAPGAAGIPSGEFVINESAATTGSVTMAFADGTGFGGAVEVRKVTFRAATAAARTGALTITATDLSGAGPTLTNLLPRTVTSFYPFRTR